ILFVCFKRDGTPTMDRTKSAKLNFSTYSKIGKENLGIVSVLPITKTSAVSIADRFSIFTDTEIIFPSYIVGRTSDFYGSIIDRFLISCCLRGNDGCSLRYCILASGYRDQHTDQ